MRYCEFAHNDAANLRAVVLLFFLQLNFVASIGPGAMNGTLKKRKKFLQMLLLAALVQVFEQS